MMTSTKMTGLFVEQVTVLLRLGKLSLRTMDGESSLPDGVIFLPSKLTRKILFTELSGTTAQKARAGALKERFSGTVSFFIT